MDGRPWSSVTIVPKPRTKTTTSGRSTGRSHNGVRHAICYRDDCTYLFYEPTSPAGHAWNELLRAPDRELAFRALEAATLWGARRGLRNGSFCGSRMPNSMAISTDCYCGRCVGLQLGEPSSTGTICRPRQIPSLNARLPRLAAAAAA